MNQVKWDSRAEAFILGVPATRLETMPAFEADQWPNLERKDWEKALVDHASMNTNPDRNDNPDRINDPDRNNNPDRINDPANRSNPDRNQPDADKDHMGKTLIRLSDISGTNIKAGTVVTDDDRDVTLEEDRKQIGEIDGAIIETTTARVPFVIISTGGILGFGEDDRIVPWQAMTMHGDDLVLNGITADQFKSLTPVKKADIAKCDSPDDVEAWYAPFSVEPDEFKPKTEPTRPGG
jgi:hypothetical protein